MPNKNNVEKFYKQVVNMQERRLRVRVRG